MNTQNNLNFKRIFLTNFLEKNSLIIKELCEKHQHLDYDELFIKYFGHIQDFLDTFEN
jgi:hypothetical protein